MVLVFEDKNAKRRVIKKEDEIFSLVNEGLYSIKIAVRVKGKEILQVEIDDRKFPINSPAVFAGGKLKGLKGTIFYILSLKGGQHTISLIPGQGADLEECQVFQISNNLTIDVNDQADDGDRRPWVTFVFADLFLASVTPTITYSQRKRDSDDVKMIINGQVQGNWIRTIKHFLWHFAVSLLPKGSSKTEAETFTVNLPQGLHYIEFWADRMPTLQNIEFSFRSTPAPSSRIPIEIDPVWTGNFNDDTDTILLARLIFGEAEGQPQNAKTGVGFSVLNRLKKQNSNWGLSIKEIILKENQYDAMWNSNTIPKVRDPLNGVSDHRKKEWQESCEIAVGIITGQLSDPTNGATNFHSFTDPKDFPVWATSSNFKVKLGDLFFYALES